MCKAKTTDTGNETSNYKVLALGNNVYSAAVGRNASLSPTPLITFPVTSKRPPDAQIHPDHPPASPPFYSHVS